MQRYWWLWNELGTKILSLFRFFAISWKFLKHVCISHIPIRNNILHCKKASLRVSNSNPQALNREQKALYQQTCFIYETASQISRDLAGLPASAWMVWKCLRPVSSVTKCPDSGWWATAWMQLCVHSKILVKTKKFPLHLHFPSVNNDDSTSYLICCHKD